MSNQITSLGIDPSLTSTGIVLLEGEGIREIKVVKTNSKQALGERYNLILTGILEIAEGIEIHTAAIEDPSHARNTAVANKLGGAWGTAFLACHQLGLDAHSVKATQHRKPWKNQTKAGAVKLVRGRWPELLEWRDDLADAASVAWWAHLVLAEAIESQK